MRPVTLLAQSFLFVTSVVAVPAILQPREDLATGCAYVSDLQDNLAALSKEITSAGLISGIEGVVVDIVVGIDTLAGDLSTLDTAMSCEASKTKRDSLSSPKEPSALEQRQSPPSVCDAAKAVAGEIATLEGDVEALLPSLDPALAAEIEKTLAAIVGPSLAQLGC